MPDRDDPIADIAASLRTVLHGMAVDLVPARLDRVLAHSGKRLTPPLAKRLLDEVDSNEWLRDQMLAEIDADDDPALHAFLERGPGWWRLVAQPGVSDDDEKHRAVTQRLQSTQRRLEEAKRRVKRLRQENERLQTELRAERSATVDTTRPPTDVGEHTSRIATLEAELGDLTADRDALRQRVDDLRRRRPERSRRMDVEQPTLPERGFGRVRPVELARRLDLEFAAMMEPGANVRDTTPIHTKRSAADRQYRRRGDFKVPDGIAPDGAGAIAWLTTLMSPLDVIVDGYNVTYLLDAAAFRTGPARRSLVEQLAALRRQLPAGATLDVVFDSADGVDTEPVVTAAGVGVRFTATGVIADDDIVATVAAADRPVVVVSNDRELRTRTEALGAVALWGDALTDWLGR